MLTDDEILAALETVGIPRERPFARDVGPYDVTEPTYDMKRLVAEIERRVAERAAQMLDKMISASAPGGARLGLAIAANAVRRGRPLTDAEKMENLKAALAEK